jgi:hypothetical protein
MLHQQPSGGDKWLQIATAEPGPCGHRNREAADWLAVIALFAFRSEGQRDRKTPCLLECNELQGRSSVVEQWPFNAKLMGCAPLHHNAAHCKTLDSTSCLRPETLHRPARQSTILQNQ